MSGKCPFHSSSAAPPTAAPEPPKEIPGGDECPHLRKVKAEQQKSAAEGAATDSHEPASWMTASPDELKTHFTKAYNEVADRSARNPLLNDQIAATLIERLGYSKEEIDIIGQDISLMQGTGNPHRFARLQAGEVVVDLGSGFGLDAILASSRVGSTGRVIGVDLSLSEISSALHRISKRRIRNVDFRHGDIEALPIEDVSVDAVISNGGFCLVPDKQRAFAEVARVLKPGGRMSISCTVRLRPLDSSLDWPSCMVVFMPLAEVEPVLQKLGFDDVVVDLSSSRMDLWENPAGVEAPPQPTPAAAAAAKVTIHRGESRYAFLKSLDMSEYFARVNIAARKL